MVSGNGKTGINHVLITLRKFPVLPIMITRGGRNRRTGAPRETLLEGEAMFQLWKPGRQEADNYHLARAYEERVRAQLTQSDAARVAHLQLSELHYAASRAAVAKPATEARPMGDAIRVCRLPAQIAGPRYADRGSTPLLAYRGEVIELRSRRR
jgi:hypothetical protein